MIIKHPSEMPSNAIARIFKSVEPELRRGLDPNGKLFVKLVNRVFPAAGGLWLPDYHDTRVRVADDWPPFALGVVIGQHLATRGFVTVRRADSEEMPKGSLSVRKG